jgi:hypothetical protein
MAPDTLTVLGAFLFQIFDFGLAKDGLVETRFLAETWFLISFHPSSFVNKTGTR